MTRVYLIDDHPTFRAGLRSLLEREDDFRVIGEAGNTKVALGQLRLMVADLLILDIRLAEASGLSVIPELLALRADLKIIIFTMHRDWSYLEFAREHGAHGYILKETEPDALLAAIRSVVRGNRVFPEARATYAKQDASALALLSPREREVLRLVGRGLLSREIAEALDVSVRTVDAHRTKMIEKLKLRGAAELVKFAVAQNSG